MKRVIKKSIYIWGVFTLLCACNNEIGTISPLELESESESNFEAPIALLKKYSSQVSLETKSNLNSELKVKSTKHETFNLEVEEFEGIPETKSAEIPDSVQVDLYTIEFEKAGDSGFAIVASDNNVERVYAYTEKGSLADTINIPALAYTLDNIKYICRDDVVKSKVETKVETRGTPGFMTPTLFSMANTYPYNKYFPKSSCTWNTEYQGYQSTHWTAVAVATVCLWYDANRSYSGKANTDDFAHKLYEVAKNAAYNTHVNCYPFPYGTSDDFPIAQLKTYLANHYSGKYEYYAKQKSLDEKKAIDTIRNGFPIVIHTGSAVYAQMSWIWQGGHYFYGSGNDWMLSDLYCLWGWDGVCDGYYVNYYQPSNKNYPYTQNGKGFKQFLYFK